MVRAMNEIIIGEFKTNERTKSVSINFSIPTLKLTATVDLTQSEFVMTTGESGFDGVKKMLVTKLIDGLDNLVKEV